MKSGWQVDPNTECSGSVSPTDRRACSSWEQDCIKSAFPPNTAQVLQHAKRQIAATACEIANTPMLFYLQVTLLSFRIPKYWKDPILF